MIPRDINFSNPKAAILMLAAFLLILLFQYAFLMRKRAADRFAPPELLAKMADLRPKGETLIRCLAFLLSWIFACLALMGPQGNAHYSSSVEGLSQEAFNQNILFLIDTSESMSVKDTRTKETRLSAAKEIADQIAKRLVGYNLMLISLTTEAYPVVPLTLDNLYFRLVLKQLNFNEGEAPQGTDFFKIFSNLKNVYDVDPKSHYQILIVLSDGEDLQLDELSADMRQRRINEIASFVSPKNFPHLKVFTIGMGSETGGEVPGVIFQGRKVISKLNTTLLKAISRAGGGEFYAANNDTSEELANQIVTEIKEREKKLQKEPLRGVEGGALLTYDEYFQIPLLLSLIALTIAFFYPFRKSSVQVLFLIILINSQHLEAQEEDFAARLSFESHGSSLAISLYQGLLENGNSEVKTAFLKYNLATSYLAAKQWDQAIQSYREIILDASLPKLLKQRVRYNLALAHYNKAADEKNLLEAINQLRLANFEISQMEEACLKPCDATFEITHAKTIYRNALSERVRAFWNLSNLLPLNTRLSVLSYFLAKNDEAAALLQKGSLPSETKKAYRNFFLKDQALPQKLWSDLSPNTSIGQLFTEAKLAYEKGKIAFQLDNLEESRKRFQQAGAQIQELFNHLHSDSKEVVSHLAALYEQRKNDPKVLPFDLFLIGQFQQRALQLLPKDESLIKGLEVLKQSVEANKKGLFNLESLFLIQARLAVLSTLRSFEENLPIQALYRLIDQGDAALNIERIFFKNGEEINAFITSKNDIEKEVLARARKFFPTAVLEYQKKQFSKGYCQCDPWDDALPLYFLGLEQWKKGQKTSFLEKANLHTSAMANWKKALELLKISPGPKKETMEQASKEDTLRRLQEMELLDEPIKPAKPLRKGEKSW